ncbi:MAG: hypothetical protein P4M10_04640, partial [Verrucomicrobiae bacterium]|nr:hypothetical protein [Verrucomicrobiae bacterium]
GFIINGRYGGSWKIAGGLTAVAKRHRKLARHASVWNTPPFQISPAGTAENVAMDIVLEHRPPRE